MVFYMSKKTNSIELLAPAGKREALVAAVEAGADAVYLGLKGLNARRGADNFDLNELPEVVEYAHKNGTKVYLTLNTHISCREVGQASRALEAASKANVDAVLIADSMFLSLVKFYPNMEFHFSTQAAIENSEGVNFASRVGVKRVVLAREMSFDEIKKASANEKVETEIFAQGALCFCVSGRCLMSSWGGGRSGNRGTCTSPCRVLWNSEDDNEKAFLSMHDLSLLDKITQIEEAGVASIKIEGRLKKADWVSQAVKIYRDAINGNTPDPQKVAWLSEYTGREQTSGYFDGNTQGLCGRGGRVSNEDAAFVSDLKEHKPEAGARIKQWKVNVSTATGVFIANAVINDGEFEASFELPLTVVKIPKKAAPVSSLETILSVENFYDLELQSFHADQPEKLLARKTVNGFCENMRKIYHSWQKRGADTTIRFPLPDDISYVIESADDSTTRNHIPLRKDTRVDTVRLNYDIAKRITGTLSTLDRVILANVPADKVSTLAKNYVVALPPVFYEEQVESVKRVVAEAVKKGLPVEVNSYSGIEIATVLGAEMIAGPGLMVLNHMAVKSLEDLGVKEAFISIEADQKQIGELCDRSRLPLTIMAYGHPILGVTRAELDDEIKDGSLIEDARGIRLKIEKGQDLTILRSADAYSIMSTACGAIRVNKVCADLGGIKNETRLINTIKMLREGRDPSAGKGRRFNFNRTFK